jgi:hypothetical protein
MEKLLLADNEMISIWIDPDRKLIHHQMKTYAHGPLLREALLKAVDAMVHHRATKWLSDDRAHGASRREDEEWSLTTWVPRALAAGWKYWAIVQPEKVIGQISMKRAVKQMAELGLEARLFSDPDEAMAWLDGV